MRIGPGFYSRLVAVLKVGLPLIALALLAGLFFIPAEDRLEGELEFSRADLAALGSGLRITRPTFTGTSRGGDRFRFTAELVVPDAATPTRASIEALAGHVEFADGRGLELGAETAELDIEAQRMQLMGAVEIETSDGYRIIANRLDAELGTATLTATGDVVAVGPMGRIAAATMTIAPAASDGDARMISFGKGVRLVYDPPDAR